MRPAYLYEELKDACPLREDIIGDGFDLVVMRELTGVFTLEKERHLKKME